MMKTIGFVKESHLEFVEMDLEYFSYLIPVYLHACFQPQAVKLGYLIRSCAPILVRLQ